MEENGQITEAEQKLSSCGVMVRKNVWPYVRRCTNRAEFTLLGDLWKFADDNFSMDANQVCEVHRKLITEAYNRRGE